MKTNCWLILGTMLATSAVAQVNTNALPPIPAPVIAPVSAPVAPVMATNETKVAPPKNAAPVKHKKKIAAKPVAKKIAEAPVTLVPGPATVNAENVNYRGQAGLKGEAIGHLKKGDSVTVLAQINLDKHAADEPAQWAKITLPAGTKVWVNAKFIDATNKVVAVKKLNLRAGPGENYSVLGVLERGASITETSAKGDWTQIETPTNAFAFVSASYLKQEAAVEPVPVVTPAVPLPPETTNTVAEPQPIVTQPTAIPATPEMSIPAPTLNNAAPAAVVVPSVVAPVIETNLPPPPPRIVTHEGWVRSSVSPVAPTYFELYDPTTGNAINYLYSTTTNLNLSYYNRLQIVVTGEEGLDARWHDTPVLTVQRIYVLSGKLAQPKTAPKK
jgi:uncharacterized protein YgiM (DUF1202 family)